MPQTLVATDLDLAFDVLIDLTPEIPFNAVVGPDPIADPYDLLVGEIPNSPKCIDTGSLASFDRLAPAHPVDIGERNVQTLVTR
jgi:hypothetical protein